MELMRVREWWRYYIIFPNIILVYIQIREWWRCYVIFPKAVAFIWGLILVHSWTENAVVALLITRLSEIMPISRAAWVVNVLDGLTGFVMLLNAYFSETYLGPFRDLVCTTIAYISGVLLFYLGAEMGLKRVEIKLVYAAVIPIALGRAGCDIQLREFLSDQCRTEEAGENEERVESRRKIWWRSAYILGIIASLYLSTKASWTTLCIISVVAMFAALLLFSLGFESYERKKPAKATLHYMLRALYLAIKRRLYRQPLDYLKANTRTLRGFSRRAAVEDQNTQVVHDEEDVIWTRFENEFQSLVTLLPLWLTLVVFGLLLATANTFFYQQTDYTANYLGKISAFSDQQSGYSCNDSNLHISSLKVSASIFVIIRYSTSFLLSGLCDFLLRSRWGDNVPRIVWLVRCGVGLAVSPICCVVAWKIEEHRKDQRMNHAICIRFPWLFPQFILMGLMEGLVSDGMESIFISVVPHTLERYGPTFTQFALNIGHFVSLLFIFIFRSLFDDDLDFSKLGVYYRNIGCVCLVNFVFYFCVAIYYLKQESSSAGDEVMDLQALQEIHDLEEQGLESSSAGYEVMDQALQEIHN